MRIDLFAAGIVACCFATACAVAQQQDSAAPTDKEAVHNELRSLAKGLTDAVLKGDVEKQLTYATKDVVVTWQNGEVVRGHQGLKDFVHKNQGAASKVFQGLQGASHAHRSTILYGDNTGISYGTSVAQYNVLGKEFELENHWSATVVKEDGRWLIAGYHVSANILDNPLLSGARLWPTRSPRLPSWSAWPGMARFQEARVVNAVCGMSLPVSRRIDSGGVLVVPVISQSCRWGDASLAP